MKSKHSTIFLIGIFIGLFAGLLIWYWQKATSADDGALVLLDRLKAAEDRLSDLRAELRGENGQHNIVLPPNDEVPGFLNRDSEE